MNTTNEFAPSLPASNCTSCDREVVVEWTLTGEELRSLCIHCGEPLDVSHYVSLESAVELGYVAPGFEPSHGERGCRDGSCGIRQPEP